MFLRSAVVISLATLISRIFGYIRDVIIAAKLGAGVYNDIFIIIFRIPNFFRTIFGEGALNASFIPLYSGIHEAEGKDKAQKFASIVQSFLFIALLIFCIVIFVFMPKLIQLTAPGIKNKDMFILTVSLSRITIFYLFMISLVAFYGGVLNSIGKYFPFAAAPVILNIVLIIFAYMPSNEEQGLRWLAVGIVVAGVLELIWMLYFLYKAGYLLRLKKLKITQEVKLLSKRMVPGIIGSGVAQINIFVDTIIASFIPGALSYLYYADRVHQLPLALIGTTLGVVMLPMLARSFKKGEIKEGIKLHNQVLDFLLFVSIPSAFALGVMAYEIVEVLFERGAFSHKASIESAKALIAFSIGLPAYSVAKTFISNFHANGDTKTPVKVAAVCIVLNVIISLSLLSYLGHIGIALASSCSIWVNMSTLWIISSKRGWFKLYEPIKIKFLKYTISASIMAVLILLIKISLKESSVYSLLSIMILLGGNSYLMIVFGMKAMTVKELKGYLKKNK